MRIASRMLVLSSVVLAAACGRDQATPKAADDSLAWLDTMNFQPTAVASPLEAGVALDEAAAAPKAAAPKASAPKRTTSHRASSSSTRRSSSSGVYSAPAPAPRTETVRHTKRDAAIGAAAGAVIGTVAGGSRHRVKGAIIGGATGAVLGGVIGHTVDKSTRTTW